MRSNRRAEPQIVIARGGRGTCERGAARPHIVGHSMGGGVTAAVGARHRDSVAGLVIIDSPMFREPPEEVIIRQLARKPKAYRTEEEICGRFRTEPAQATVLPYVARHVAEQSVRRTDDGWVWKFDPEMFRKRLREQSVDRTGIGATTPRPGAGPSRTAICRPRSGCPPAGGHR